MQATIAQQVEFSGKGMHDGGSSHVTLKPAPAGHGIRFFVTNRKGDSTEFRAHIDEVVRYPACTCLGKDSPVQLKTVEHLLAACFAMGIDNLRVDVQGEEIPILDGSAAPIVSWLKKAGIKSLGEPQRYIEVLKPITYSDEHRSFKFEPHDCFAVDINIHPGEYGHLRWYHEMTPEHFRTHIMQAAAWGRLRDVWLPKVIGRFLPNKVLQGAGLDTAVVYFRGKPLNPGKLNHTDDMVRHKVLDIVGDLMLLGYPLKGKVTCHSSAHCTNHSAMRQLLADTSAWQYV